MKEVYYSKNVAETEALGENLAKKLPENCFIAMYGDLGMGKTAFVRGLCKSLCPDDRVTSPTYTIVNIYKQGKARINHFDMYRITDEDSLESVGFYDYLPQGITVCEWCENIPFALPEVYLEVRFSLDDDNNRVITLCVKGGEGYADLGY